MKSITKTLLLATLVASALTACGSDPATSGTDATTAAVASAARHLESSDGDDREVPDDRDGDGDDDERDQEVRVSRFKALLDELRAVPALQPLFWEYGVPDPIVWDASARGLVDLLRAVRIRVSFGSLAITNRETGGVIYAAPLADLASGTYQPEHLPGSGTPPPPSPVTCTYFTYSPWGACQVEGTQARTVLTAAPAGCTGGTPVTTQACTYVPPSPTTCTSFTYSAWGACQPTGTQTRTVLASSPAGCTGGAPVTSQTCTYTAPACTYTYSAWSTCSAAGTQTRTIVSSAPAGCAGTPVLSQPCTPPAQACNTCHGVPPSTGTHGAPHALSCGTCHGAGYSATTVAATHRDGAVNLAATSGWNASTRSCANSCHGSRSW